MNVYRLNEYEWWAAHTLEEAIEVAMKDTGNTHEETVDVGFEPHLLDEKAMQETFHDEDGNTFTIAALLDAMTGPGLVAASEA